MCGCTDADCAGCIWLRGEPCRWVLPDLCSSCVDADVLLGVLEQFAGRMSVTNSWLSNVLQELADSTRSGMRAWRQVGHDRLGDRG